MVFAGLGECGDTGGLGGYKFNQTPALGPGGGFLALITNSAILNSLEQNLEHILGYFLRITY